MWGTLLLMAEERRKSRGKVKKRRRTDQTLVFCPEYIQTIFIQGYSVRRLSKLCNPKLLND